MADIGINVFFDEFKSFVEDLSFEKLQTNLFTEDISVADELLGLAKNAYQGLVLFFCLFKEIYVSTVSVDADCIEFTETLAALIEMYSDMTQRMKERCDMLEERNTDTGFRCHVRNVGDRGRPRFVVSKNRVQGLKDLGFSWTKISTMIGVSRTTLHRRRQELGLNTVQAQMLFCPFLLYTLFCPFLLSMARSVSHVSHDNQNKNCSKSKELVSDSQALKIPEF